MLPQFGTYLLATQWSISCNWERNPKLPWNIKAGRPVLYPLQLGSTVEPPWGKGTFAPLPRGGGGSSLPYGILLSRHRAEEVVGSESEQHSLGTEAWMWPYDHFPTLPPPWASTSSSPRPPSFPRPPSAQIHSCISRVLLTQEQPCVATTHCSWADAATRVNATALASTDRRVTVSTPR